MTEIPSTDKLEKCLVGCLIKISQHTSKEINRQSDIHITFTEGDAIIEINTDGTSITHTVRVREIQKMLEDNPVPVQDDKVENSGRGFKEKNGNSKSYEEEGVLDGVRDELIG